MEGLAQEAQTKTRQLWDPANAALQEQHQKIVGQLQLELAKLATGLKAAAPAPEAAPQEVGQARGREWAQSGCPCARGRATGGGAGKRQGEAAKKQKPWEGWRARQPEATARKTTGLVAAGRAQSVAAGDEFDDDDLGMDGDGPGKTGGGTPAASTATTAEQIAAEAAAASRARAEAKVAAGQRAGTKPSG